MGLFGRGARARTAEDAVGDPASADEAIVDGTVVDGAAEADPTFDGRSSDAHAPATRTGGPWDVDEVDGPGLRVDLGAILLPAVAGMELRMEVDQASNLVSAVAVSLDGSTLQIQAFAAPRTEGIWDDIRAEIAESVIKQGGSADDLPGPFGRELLARLPVRTAEGRTGHRPARFIGADGPRWFVRGVVTGKAAVDPAAAEAVERIFAEIVVVRGTEACAPRDLLALRMPGQVADQQPEPTPQSTPSFDLTPRGPEITEVR